MAGFATVIIGAVFQITDPSGPLNAIFVLAMGVLILPAGAPCLISSIGMRQRTPWGCIVALGALWPMAMLGAPGVVTGLAQLQIGAAFLSSWSRLSAGAICAVSGAGQSGPVSVQARRPSHPRR